MSQLPLGLGHEGPGVGDVLHNLFFAVMLEEEVALRAFRLGADFCGDRGITGARLRPDRLHVTLLTLLKNADEPPSPSLAAMAKCFGSEVDFPAFTVCFDRILTLGGKDRRALALAGGEGVIGADLLHDALSDAQMRMFGLPPKPTPILPHVTLAYVGREVGETPVDPVVWRVRSFSLVHSLVGLTRHIRLQTWDLREGAWRV